MSRQAHESVFNHGILLERSGFVRIEFKGRGAMALFQSEAGGHRWQRVSPTEKRDRVHTSTVTVAVLDPTDLKGFTLKVSDVEIKTKRGSGAGGQHRNKTDSCVVATHRPTGVVVKVDGRCQHQNRARALETLEERLQEMQMATSAASREGIRRSQVGSGMRGDKIRTYRTQDDTVVDHVTGKKWRLKLWLKGEW